MTKPEPIFAPIFGDDWEYLPSVMKMHYANRPNCNDVVTVKGVLDIEISSTIRFLAPLIRLSRILAPYSGQNVRVTVHFRSEPNSDAFCFDRTFHYPGRKPIGVFSRMMPVGNKEVIEWMRAGLGWHARIRLNGQRIFLDHLGYKLRLFGKSVSFPVTWLIGSGSAQEWSLSDTRFGMSMELRHPFFGKIYGYNGVFDISEMNIDS